VFYLLRGQDLPGRIDVRDLSAGFSSPAPAQTERKNSKGYHQMIRPEFKTILLDQRGAAVIIWSFFTISIGIYLFISRHLLANPDFGRGFSYAGTSRAVFWILTFIDFGYYVYWKRYLTPEAVIRDAKASKRLRALEAYQGRDEERAAAVVSTYVTRKIVLFAIIEAIAVYGLILALVGRFLLDQYILSALALVLLIVEFPSEKSFSALLQEVEHNAREQRK
jgi:hypothetical protein